MHPAYRSGQPRPTEDEIISLIAYTLADSQNYTVGSNYCSDVQWEVTERHKMIARRLFDALNYHALLKSGGVLTTGCAGASSPTK